MVSGSLASCAKTRSHVPLLLGRTLFCQQRIREITTWIAKPGCSSNIASASGALACLTPSLPDSCSRRSCSFTRGGVARGAPDCGFRTTARRAAVLAQPRINPSLLRLVVSHNLSCLHRHDLTAMIAYYQPAEKRNQLGMVSLYRKRFPPATEPYFIPMSKDKGLHPDQTINGNFVQAILAFPYSKTGFAVISFRQRICH